MTVSSEQSYVSYVGDNVTLKFPVPFYFIQNSDLRVSVVNEDETETPLMLDTDYAVSGAGIQSGGQVTLLGDPLKSNKRLVIDRDPPATQETAYQANDPFPAKEHEKALDKLTMLVQRLSRTFFNSIHFPLFEQVDGTLPRKSERLGMLQGYDPVNGSPIMVPMPASIGAGDLLPYSLEVGTDFSPGDTQVSLPRAPGSKGNLQVHFDGVPQDFTEWDVNGATLIFADPIPSYVERIWGYIGTSLSLLVAPDHSITDNKVANDAAIQSTKLAFKRAGRGAKQRTVADVLDDIVSVKDFGAIGDGNSHPLSDFYSSLAAAQVDYPMATSLSNEIDDVAINSAILYARAAKASVEIPYGTFLVRQITIYTDTVLVGQGRNATTLKQIVGANTDLIYGANSNANWGSASPTDIVNGCTIVGMTLDGQWNHGTGNTQGSGIAVYGARPIWQDVFIKNVAEHGMRTEYNPTSSIGADAFTMEGELRNIRIDDVGKHGFWFNGPNDTVMDSVIVVDAGQLADNTYDAFHFDQYAVARCYGMHGWNRQAALRHRYALNLRPGAQCEFDDCQFEGAYSANVGIFSQRNIFSDSCRFFAAWNGVNIYMGLNATLNQIRGILDGGAVGRPASVAGIIMGSAPGDFVADNIIDILAIEQQAGVVIFNFSGGYNTIRARCYQSAGGTYSGSPHSTDDIEIRQHSPTAMDVDPKRYAAWVVFSVNSGGAVTINASYNVTTVTRSAPGQYTITFANEMKVFAMMHGSCDYGQIVGKKVTPVRPGGNTALTQDVHFRSDDGTYGDPNFASIGFVSGL